jgi:Tfp pilus assembly protein PilF
MGVLPRVLIVSLASVALVAPAISQKADSQINPKSVALQRQGQALLSAGKIDAAEDVLETALAVDPRNRRAFVDLARVAEKQRLFGKAIRMTSRALLLEPNDLDAIAVQGEAMVEAGAVPRARETLAKLQKLCAGPCPQAAALSAAITRGPAMAEAKPAAPKKIN